MSTSDIDRYAKKLHFRKTIVVYFLLSLLAIAIDNIYAIFGHGVHSSAMTWMFLYPLIGGAFFYFLMARSIAGISKEGDYRLFYNIYNSGIAILTLGGFLKGILDIAGTSSNYVTLFKIIGWMALGIGLLLLISVIFRYIDNLAK